MSNVNVSDISKAVRLLIEKDPTLQGKVKRSALVRAGFVNDNPGITPWIGVYKGVVSYVPRTLGRHATSWQMSIETQILIQEYSAGTGEQAEDKLEELIKDVMRLILDNPTLGGTVDMVLAFKVEYRFLEGENETAYFQMAMLTVTSEVATG